MKRFLPLILVVFVLFTFSCRNAVPHYPLLIITNEDGIPSSIAVPVFYDGPSITTEGANTPSTSGIIDMTPEGSPFENMQAASSIMRTMPIMIGLNLEDNGDGSVLSRIPETTTAFGFKLRFDSKNSRVNNDGAFIRYNVMSEQADTPDTIVGRIDYYYNAKEQTFSYREIVALSIDFSVIAGEFEHLSSLYQMFVLVMEYKDIPIKAVEENGKISFTTANLGRNGEMDKNSFVDLIQLTWQTTDPEAETMKMLNMFTFNRSYLLAKSGDGLFASINMPYYGRSTEKEEGYPSNIAPIVSEITNGKMRFDEESAKRFDIDYALRIIEAVYGKTYRHETYHSAGNFSSDSFDRINGITVYDASELAAMEFVTGPMRSTVSDCMPALLNLETGKAASTQLSYPSMPGEFSSISNNELYDNSGFGAFCGYLDFSEEHRKTSRTTLIRNVLESCGVNNEQFIENFITAVDMSSRERIEITESGTNTSGYNEWTALPVNSYDSTGDFREKLDTLYGELDPESTEAAY